MLKGTTTLKWNDDRLADLCSYCLEEDADLMMVKDQGLYLMARAPKDERPDIIYYEGCHPEKDDDFYRRQRELVGGDDFAEEVPERIVDSVAGYEEPTLEVRISKRRISFAVLAEC